MDFSSGDMFSDLGRFDAPFLLRSKLSAGDVEIILVMKQPSAYVAGKRKKTFGNK